MKARVNKDRTIELLDKLPNAVLNSKGQAVLGVSNLDNTKLQALGFYPVVLPELTPNQILGELFFDSENHVVTYRVKSKPEGDLQSMYREKTEELNQLEDHMRELLVRNTIDKLIEGDTTAAAAVLKRLKAVKQATQTKLRELFEAGNFEKLNAFSLQTQEAETLREAIEALKQQ